MKATGVARGGSLRGLFEEPVGDDRQQEQEPLAAAAVVAASADAHQRKTQSTMNAFSFPLQLLRRIQYKKRLVEVCAGLTTFFFLTVFVCTFASSVSLPCEWMDSAMTSELARASMLSYLFCGVPYLASTQLWYSQPIGPDLSVAPMLAQVAVAIGESYDGESSRDAFCVLLVVASLSTLISGLFIIAMSRYGLLRFAEYLPFPVVSGLLGSVGGALVHSAVLLGSPRSADASHRIIALLLTASVAAIDVYVQTVTKSTVARFGVCVIAPTLLAACAGLNSENWFFPASTLGSEAFDGLPPLFRALRSGRGILRGGERLGKALDALSVSVEPALALIILTVLKAPIVDAAMRKALRKSPQEDKTQTAKSGVIPSLGELTNESFVAERTRTSLLRSASAPEGRIRLSSSLSSYGAASPAGGDEEEQEDDDDDMGSTRREMVLVGLSNVLCVIFGCVAVQGQSLSLSVLSKGLGVAIRTKLPGAINVGLALVSSLFPESIVTTSRTSIPRFVYAGIVTSNGLRMLHQWIVVPSKYLAATEVAAAATIVLLALARGFAVGVTAGAACCVCMFAVASHRAPVVKYVATSQTFRSNRQRDMLERDVLDTEGDRIVVVVLQGYLFFGNGVKVLNFVAALLEQDALSSVGGMFVIVDCTLCLGADASAVDALLEASKLVAATHNQHDLIREGPALYISGSPDSMREALKKRSCLPSDVVLSRDLDRACELCEDRLLLNIRRTKSRRAALFTPTKRPPANISSRRPKNDDELLKLKERDKMHVSAGLLAGLREKELPPPAQQASTTEPKKGKLEYSNDVLEAMRFSLNMTALSEASDGREIIARLEVALASRAKVVRLSQGRTLMSRARAGEPVDPRVDAVYVVASGRIAVRHDPQQSTGGLFSSQNAFSNPRTRSGRRVGRRLRNPRGQAWRLAEVGTGSFVGIEEFATRVRSVGVFTATTPSCVLHKISFAAIDDMVAQDHYLGTCFFRLVTAILTDDIDALKFRLSSTVDALYSKPLVKPVRRATLRALAEFAPGASYS